MLPEKLHKKLQDRSSKGALRSLPTETNLIDFSSNDYLGFSRDSAFAKAISQRATAILQDQNNTSNGATGSRLLSGNHGLYANTESLVASFHKSETALIFNSGYDANIGFFQSVPQRGDVILYDEYIHASIRDGLKMSNAKAYKFKHNDLDDLEKLVSSRAQSRGQGQEIYIITESIFSMDGDSPDLKAMAALCTLYDSYLIVDEAHATGVVGSRGEGLVCELGLENSVFARIVTFGKGIGAHGAAILGSEQLRDYLVNFARSFIYTTALPPHTLATIQAGYEQLTRAGKQHLAIAQLHDNIAFFNQEIVASGVQSIFIPSTSAIHCAVIPGNDRVKTLSRKLKQHGYDVKPILSPTVPEGQERLRFCLHSYNTEEEIKSVVSLVNDEINI